MSSKLGITRDNWRKLYRKMTNGTPRDKAVEAFIEELLRSIDVEQANNRVYQGLLIGRPGM
jgi:hypothetical protein